MKKHTKGPWKITRGHCSPCSIEPPEGDGSALAKVYLTDPTTRRRTEEQADNAELIRRSPELYQLLCNLRDSGNAVLRAFKADSGDDSVELAGEIFVMEFDVQAAIDLLGPAEPVTWQREEAREAQERADGKLAQQTPESNTDEAVH